ncbi:hypothetical protein [Pontibacillus yanchengensis]|nr:hypothetical protein [Pontibacillus yanchengensis]
MLSGPQRQQEVLLEWFKQQKEQAQREDEHDSSNVSEKTAAEIEAKKEK